MQNPTPQDSTSPQLSFMLHDVARLLRKRFEQHGRNQLGLTRAQWQALVYLSKNEGIHQGGLADLLEVEPITIGRILDRLQSQGLVERRPHTSDRRIWLLYLTPKAAPKLDEMRALGEITRSEAFDGISASERETLLNILSRMKDNLLTACAAPAASRQVNHG